MDIKDIYDFSNNTLLSVLIAGNWTKDSIFISLKGENFNGNKYALKAIQDGCAYAIVDEEEYDVQSNIQFLFMMHLKTLQDLATYHRNQLNIPLIGITGTNGKTTSKELINAILNSELSCMQLKEI